MRTGEVNGKVKAGPTISDEIVYAANSVGEVYAVELASGSEQWKISVPSPVKGSPAIADGTLFLGTDSGVFYAIDAQAGEIVWEYETRSGEYIYSPPVVTQEKIYFGSGDNHLYCLSLDGEKQWDFETGGAIGSSPAIVDDTLFIGSHDGNLYALRDER
jgi:outer membrane protein assembly factor BamB